MHDFIRFVAGVMNVDPAALSAETAYNSIPQWDSLMHMQLVMEVEEEYGVEIPIEQIAEVQTLGDLYRFVRE